MALDNHDSKHSSGSNAKPCSIERAVRQRLAVWEGLSRTPTSASAPPRSKPMHRRWLPAQAPEAKRASKPTLPRKKLVRTGRGATRPAMRKTRQPRIAMFEASLRTGLTGRAALECAVNSQGGGGGHCRNNETFLPQAKRLELGQNNRLSGNSQLRTTSAEKQHDIGNP